MGNEQTSSTPAKRSANQPVKITKFQAPAELGEHLGAIVVHEDFIQGVVETKYVRELLDAFGLAERKEVVFPFQHLKKGQGEIWSMRIEPAAGHTVDGSPVVGHQWIYHQAMPERVGSAA